MKGVGPGPGIFDDPLAQEVRAAFELAVAGGTTVPDATQEVLQKFGDAADDPARSPALWLALAWVQSERGALQGGIRKRALAAILSGRGLAGWENSGPEALAARQAVLEDLRWRVQ